jgi:sugar phosphate isomerase/epimerase
VSAGEGTGRDELGIFARTFPRDTAAQVAGAVQQAGFGLVQLNLNSFGLPTIPPGEVLAGLDLPGVRAAFADCGISIWGVSVTYNMIDPDAGRRTRATAQARAFIERIPVRHLAGASGQRARGLLE